MNHLYFLPLSLLDNVKTDFFGKMFYLLLVKVISATATRQRMCARQILVMRTSGVNSATHTLTQTEWKITEHNSKN